MTAALGLGYSTCPNDTFMFHALVSGLVQPPAPLAPLSFAPWMADIEELNLRATGADPLPITKVSAAVLGRITDDYAVLSAGAALGRGNGPLVLRRRDDRRWSDLASLSGARVAIPGAATTANLLLGIFGPADIDRVPLRFDAIMNAIASGEVDAGVVIHESRFTYPEHGLAKIADLGTLWEDDTGLPLPLGVIVARRALGAVAEAVEHALRASVAHALADPTASAAYVRKHAQELSPDVCRQHIALYVNDHSLDLGDPGRAAIETLLARGRASAVLPPQSRSPWR